MKRMKSVDVFGFGHCCVDYLSVLAPYPAKGKKGVVKQSLVIAGGPVPTALATLAKFGKVTRFCGVVGDDPEGRKVLNDLGQFGVDVEWMVVDPSVTTARSFVWIDPSDGTRTIALDVTRFRWLSAEELNDRLPMLCRVCLVDGRAVDATLKGLQIAKSAGVVTVLDVGSFRPRWKELLPLIDFAIVSQDLGDTLCPGSSAEELAEQIHKDGAGEVVVTLGDQGALWYDGRRATTFPAHPLTVIDTTGAGDVFHGAFIYGLLERWDRGRTIRFANKAAALSCRRLSGLHSIPTLKEVMGG